MLDFAIPKMLAESKVYHFELTVLGSAREKEILEFEITVNNACDFERKNSLSKYRILNSATTRKPLPFRSQNTYLSNASIGQH
jgi:hypothetical protein